MKSSAGDRSVLITGCSTGIGRETALRLASRGFAVYATARRPETLEALGRAGCRTLRLDTTDERSMRAVVDEIEADHGAVDTLVNNAGYGLQGALEELDPGAVRTQFETNLFGPLRLTQMVLPAMRPRRRGTIVNVSSVGGRITTPGTGAYHGTKHALEAISDVLRFELRGFGIDVIVIEPGAIRTRWVDTAVAGLEGRIDPGGPYASFDRAVVDQMHGSHRGLLGWAAGSPEGVARVIEKAITAHRPRRRYPVPMAAHVFIRLHQWLPSAVWDAFMRRMFPSPGEER